MSAKFFSCMLGKLKYPLSEFDWLLDVITLLRLVTPL